MGEAAAVGGGLKGATEAAKIAQGDSKLTGTASGTRLDPRISGSLYTGHSNISGQADLLKNTGNAFAGQAAAGIPQLNTNFNQLAGVNAFQPGQAGIDSLGRQQIALGTQQLNQGANAYERAIQRQFAGQPGVGQALAKTAGFQAKLGANPLLAGAAQGSVDRGQQGFQNVVNLGQAQAGVQQQGNQSLLSQQGAGTAGRAEAIQNIQAGLGGLNTNQNTLSNLGTLTGEQWTKNDYANRGGLFNKS